MGNDPGITLTPDRRSLTAPANGRIDAVLAASYPDLTRARLQRLIAAGHVLLNGEAVRKSGQVYEGDVLTLEIPPVEHTAAGPNFELAVLYEDSDLLAIDKPPRLAVHGGPGDTSPVIAAWFVQRYPEAASHFDAERPGIVHRLDKDTSGVLLLAKTPAAQAALSAAFEARTVKKTYLAITEGVPDRPRAVVDAPIARHPGDRTRMAVARHGRDARTEYETIASGRGRAFLVVRPTTGRTHQIRVHLAAIGAPVAGDRVYGRTSREGRHLLHAWQADLPHPAGGRLVVTAPLPEDMQGALRDLAPGLTWASYALPQAPVRSSEAPES